MPAFFFPGFNPFAEYIIPYKGLKDGIHLFEYQINDAFFSLFEESEISQAEVSVGVEMEKRPQFIILKFRLQGFVLSQCDVCLGELSIPIDHFEEVVIKFGEVIEDMQIVGEERPILSEKDFEINVAHQIFELVHLCLPLKRVHPDDSAGVPSCDPDMLKEIKKYLVGDQENPAIDPRWEKLSGLQSAINN